MPYLNRRELATVLAALRHWPERESRDVMIEHLFEIDEIATDNGSFSALTDAEIDALCERLNIEEPEMATLTSKEREAILRWCAERLTSWGDHQDIDQTKHIDSLNEQEMRGLYDRLRAGAAAPDLPLNPQPTEGAFKPALDWPRRAFLDVSTGNLDPVTIKWLANSEATFPAFPTDHGFFVYAPNEWNEPDDSTPPDLRTILEYARSVGCEYVLFDADASALPGFPWFGDDE